MCFISVPSPGVCGCAQKAKMCIAASKQVTTIDDGELSAD